MKDYTMEEAKELIIDAIYDDIKGYCEGYYEDVSNGISRDNIVSNPKRYSLIGDYNDDELKHVYWNNENVAFFKKPDYCHHISFLEGSIDEESKYYDVIKWVFQSMLHAMKVFKYVFGADYLSVSMNTIAEYYVYLNKNLTK